MVVADPQNPYAFSTGKVQGAEVKVNPGRVSGIYVPKPLAASYDGFWILLHELFHRADSSIITELAQAQNDTVLRGLNQASYIEDDKGNDENWRDDPGDNSKGVNESFINILRIGHNLPTRVAYGAPLKYPKPVEDLLYDDPQIALFEGAQGVARARRTLSPREERRFVSHLLDSYPQSKETSGDSAAWWAPRILNSRMRLRGYMHEGLSFEDVDITLKSGPPKINGDPYQVHDSHDIRTR
jgi:hypothetical protein